LDGLWIYGIWNAKCRSWKQKVLVTVALSFICGKYYSIMN
jgi:hypothetical protein